MLSNPPTPLGRPPRRRRNPPASGETSISKDDLAVDEPKALCWNALRGFILVRQAAGPHPGTAGPVYHCRLLQWWKWNSIVVGCVIAWGSGHLLISKWDSHDALTRVSDYQLMPGRVLAIVQSETFIKPFCSTAHCTRYQWHSLALVVGALLGESLISSVGWKVGVKCLNCVATTKPFGQRENWNGNGIDFPNNEIGLLHVTWWKGEHNLPVTWTRLR